MQFHNNNFKTLYNVKHFIHNALGNWKSAHFLLNFLKLITNLNASFISQKIKNEVEKNNYFPYVQMYFNSEFKIKCHGYLFRFPQFYLNSFNERKSINAAWLKKTKKQKNMGIKLKNIDNMYKSR